MGFGRRNRPLEELQGLASDKGFDVTKAMMTGCYHLVDNDTDKKATNINGTPSFTVQQAKLFLRGLPDRKRAAE